MLENMARWAIIISIVIIPFFDSSDTADDILRNNLERLSVKAIYEQSYTELRLSAYLLERRFGSKFCLSFST